MLSALALLVTMWIVVPAAHTFLWLVAVAASEWSLWLGAFGFAGALLGLISLTRKKSRKGIVACAFGLLTVALALYPPLAVYKLAKANEVELSLARYTFGSKIENSNPPQLFTFSTINGQSLQLDFYTPASEVAATSDVAS